MRYTSLPFRSPKKEQEVPDTFTPIGSNFNIAYLDEDFNILEELEEVFNIGEEQKLPLQKTCNHLHWDFMEWEEFNLLGEESYECEDKVEEKSSECIFKKRILKRENNYGFWEVGDEKMALNLNLNYQDVLDAWSDRGSLWADGSSLSLATDNWCYISLKISPAMHSSGDNVCHVVAMPFPGRGHINPMLNLCKFLASRRPNNILITFVITEEWLGYIGADPKPESICFSTIPNVIPPENQKAADFPAFYEAVMTKMEAPFERLLDRLDPPVTAIIGCVELRWPIAVANRRNIPVAAFWTMSALFYSMLHHIHVSSRHQNLMLDGQTENIPGISSAHLSDLRTVINSNDQRVLQLALECISKVPKANYLLLTTVQELEAEIIDSLKALFPFLVYPIGPAIPYLELGENHDHNRDYIKWLDSQPAESVLYISLGSFLSVSRTQMDEILEALNNSNIRYLWVARGEASRLKDKCGEKGMVVPWCDQLKVLSHSSIGGFWSHCGWNSTLEAVFAGVPMLTFPLFLDQVPNSSQIVDEWKSGWKVEISKFDSEVVLAKENIEELVKRFMDLESQEGKKIRERARELKVICHGAIAKGGSSDRNLDAFLSDISRPLIH